MEPHSEDGTQRLELPVSRTTLNSCGGVPTEISEKSILFVRGGRLQRERAVRTLSIQEVANGYWMVAVALECGIFEHLIDVVALRSHAHVLLAKRSRMLTEIGILLFLYKYWFGIAICICDLQAALI